MEGRDCRFDALSYTEKSERIRRKVRETQRCIGIANEKESNDKWRALISEEEGCSIEDIRVTKEYSECLGREVVTFRAPSGPIYLDENLQECRNIIDQAAFDFTTTGSGDKGPNRFTRFRKNSVNHIFDGIENHYTRTPEHLRKILELSRKASANLGNDDYGNTWHAIIENGKQVWCKMYNSEITSAGVNTVIRTFNKKTGLCKP